MSAVTTATKRAKREERLHIEDPLLSFRIDATSPPRLNSCSLDGTDHLFCHGCFTAIKQRKPPKYSALNGVNVSLCQNYPAAHQDLTLTEECLIARGHPIASIVKLRPHGVPPTNRNPALSSTSCPVQRSTSRTRSRSSGSVTGHLPPRT